MNGTNEIIEGALVNRNSLADALFKRSESLSKLLPYSEYLEEHKMFASPYRKPIREIPFN